MTTIKNVTIGQELYKAIGLLALLNDGPSAFDTRCAVRTDDSTAVLLQEVTLAWWLADGETGKPIECEGPFQSPEEAAKALEDWRTRQAAIMADLKARYGESEWADSPEPTIIQIILLDSEAA